MIVTGFLLLFVFWILSWYLPYLWLRARGWTPFAPLGCLILAACAGGSVIPVPVPTNNSGTHVRILRTLGGEFATPGMDQIGALAAKVPGVTLVQMYAYTQAQQVAADIKAEPLAVKQVIIGGSCGANAAAAAGAYANPHPIAAIADIQPSELCTAWELPLTPNVAFAQETYDPNCADTGFLGCKVLDIGPGFNPSNLILIERPECHPCSFVDPSSQQDVLLVVRKVASGAVALRAGATASRGHPRKYILHQGQHL